MRTDNPFGPVTNVALNGKNILFLNNFAHPYLGGGEVHLLHLVRAAVAADMHVSVAAPFESAIAEQAQLAGARVYEADFSAATLVQTMGILQELAHRDGPTIVHGTGYLTNLLARNVGDLVVNTIHTMPDAPLAENPGVRSQLSVRLRALVDRMTAGRGVSIVADSEAIARSLSRPGANVRVIHNGVDPDALADEAAARPVPDEVRAAREAGSRVVGCVSRLERVKGVVDLVDAAEQMAPEAVVLIAGAGSLESELRERIVARGLTDRVRLLGYVDSAASFISAVDVFVLPSHSEGFNTTILEAMALRVPVVATDVGGASEAIDSGVHGMVVPPHDAPALAEAVALVLGDAEGARRMAESARERVLERFTVEHMTREYLSLYGELLGEAR